LNDATLAALKEALDDEYKARATYRAVIDRFGEVRPFVNIIASEQRHIEALWRQYRRHGLEPPEDRWAGTVDAPASIEEACRQTAQAERDNEAMYDRLLGAIDQPEIRRVMSRLQEASRERHLPAFERCLERGDRRRGPRDHGARGDGDEGAPRRHRRRRRRGRGCRH
jgi:rubrerythrin